MLAATRVFMFGDMPPRMNDLQQENQEIILSRYDLARSHLSCGNRKVCP